jgi:hypothetical protein
MCIPLFVGTWLFYQFHSPVHSRTPRKGISPPQGPYLPTGRYTYNKSKGRHPCLKWNSNPGHRPVLWKCDFTFRDSPFWIDTHTTRPRNLWVSVHSYSRMLVVACCLYSLSPDRVCRQLASVVPSSELRIREQFLWRISDELQRTRKETDMFSSK